MLRCANKKLYFATALISAFLVLFISAEVLVAQTPLAQSFSPLGSKDAAKAEIAVGDLVADAVREATKSNIAFVAASELKPKSEPVAAGDVTSNIMSGLISYPEDPLAQLQLSGKDIRQALEKAVSIYPQPNLGFLQISGLKFAFDPKKPAGQRITSITVDGSPINNDTSYTIGMTNSLANGAIGYWKVWSKDNIKQRLADTNIIGALDNYFKAHPKINYSTLDRISMAK